MKRPRGALLALALFCLCAPATAKRRAEPPPPPPSAGGLIENVNGYTLDARGALQRFSALLIGKDGRVSRLLGAGDARPERLDFRLDGKGRTLLPGLIDAHGHMMALGLRLVSLDVADTASLAELQEKLRRYAAQHPTPLWIRGGGWNEERWGLGRAPTAADLDAVAPDRPVVLDRADGHALLANGAAMKAAGITAKTPDPPGGRIGRDAQGRPTGLFVDAAADLIRDAMPRPLPRERDEALAAAQDALIRVGVTAMTDMGTSVEDWETYRRAGDAGRLRVRILSYARGLDPLLAIAGTGPTPWLYDARLRMVGVKLVADGALGARGAWLKADYADAPGERGRRLLDDTRLRNMMSRAAMDRFQVAVHAVGDAANAQVLDAIDEEADTYTGDRRWRIEHAGVVDPGDLPRFARHGIVASMQPAPAASGWRMAEARLGPARLAGAYAWRALLDEKVPLAFGSDFPAERPDPFPGIAAATGALPDRRLTSTEALAAFTTGAAYAAFAEDRLGALTPGHLADFVLLDRDVLAAGPDEVRATQVLETWIGGKRIWVRGTEKVPPAP